MNIQWLWLLVPMAFTMGSAILCHELGHYLVLKKHGKNPKIQFYYNHRRSFGFKATSDKRLDDNKTLVMLSAGILVGVVPILYMVYTQSLIFVFLVFLYMRGCNDDVNRIVEIVKKDIGGN